MMDVNSKLSIALFVKYKDWILKPEILIPQEEIINSIEVTLLMIRKEVFKLYGCEPDNIMLAEDYQSFSPIKDCKILLALAKIKEKPENLILNKENTLNLETSLEFSKERNILQRLLLNEFPEEFESY